MNSLPDADELLDRIRKLYAAALADDRRLLREAIAAHRAGPSNATAIRLRVARLRLHYAKDGIKSDASLLVGRQLSNSQAGTIHKRLRRLVQQGRLVADDGFLRPVKKAVAYA